MTSEGTILLIEDDADAAELAIEALSSNRGAVRVVVAKDGVEALEYLDKHDLPDLVLLDLKLPKVDGFGVLQRIRENPKTRRAVVVALTSSVDPKDLARCYELGVNSYVRKPMEFADFQDAMDIVRRYWLGLNVGV